MSPPPVPPSTAPDQPHTATSDKPLPQKKPSRRRRGKPRAVVGGTGVGTGVGEGDTKPLPRLAAPTAKDSDGPGPTTIDIFRQRIKWHQKRERSLEMMLLKSADELKELLNSTRSALNSLITAQRGMKELSLSVIEHRNRYLKENGVLMEVLARVPQPIREDLEAIATASRDRLDEFYKNYEYNSDPDSQQYQQA